MMAKNIIFIIIILLVCSVITTSQEMSVESLSHAVLAEVKDIPGTISLRNSEWKGKPFVPGSAERPTVSLRQELFVSGDVNRDGKNDAAAFLVSTTGGSGVQVHLALFLRYGSSLKNAENIWLGDRVQVRSAKIEQEGILSVTMIRSGEKDGMCCPGEIVQRQWKWNGKKLNELPEKIIGRSNAAALYSVLWRLVEWKAGEPVDTNTAVTLRFSNGKVSGRSGCNQYFAGVKDGTLPGEIVISAGGSTKMMCSPELMATEDRFLRLLPLVIHFRFSFSDLVLEYEEHGIRNSLMLKQQTNDR